MREVWVRINNTAFFLHLSCMKKRYPLLLVIALLMLCNKSFAANDSIYEARRNAYVDNCLSNFSTFDITLQAYRGVPVDTAALRAMLATLPTSGTADFEIAQMVRILYFSNGQYDSIILPVLTKFPYWLTKGERLFDYWSENHMIQWMSSDYLMHQKYNMPVDDRLNYRVKHYLEMKVKYGFYEFFSTVYGPYCLDGLLNLADFAQDSTIKTLATQASQRLLSSMLMATNSLGVDFPTAGRNYYGKYETPYNQNHNVLIYLLTGLGQAPNGPTPGGVIFASSSVPVDPIIATWKNHIDTTLFIGHTLDSGFVINDSLTQTDRVLFQWSSGGYFYPEVAQQTAQLLTDSNLWGHTDFSMFSIFQTTPPNQFYAEASTFGFASKSSLICNDTVVMFKDNTVTLSSVQDFWPGKLGYEQMPCVANVGTTAVFTASGPILANFDNRAATNENNDLPYVKQQRNVALEMYRPDWGLKALGFSDPEVSLYFIDSVYDEVRNDSSWLLGRQGNGYVAVRRGCMQIINTLRACTEPNGQTWVIMVGDSDMYGSFDNFQAVVDSSKYQEGWTLDSATNVWTYSAQIVIDGMTIGYDWVGDSTLVNEYTSVQNISAGKTTFRVFPNPVSNMVNIDLSGLTDAALALKVTNVVGQEIYSENLANSNAGLKAINTAGWASGVYLISVETANGLVSKMLVKE
jgi:Secretion system C-terminal sorting domain